jgi:uroporphyrin-III C-methyltransferase
MAAPMSSSPPNLPGPAAAPDVPQPRSQARAPAQDVFDAVPGPAPLAPSFPIASPWLKYWAVAVTLVAALALLVSVLLWQKLDTIQQELARRSLDSGSQATEARTLARQAEELARALSARLALQETRVSEVSLQRTQLEELMQSLSRSRDENLVVDMESALRLAQQQAQLTGSAEPLLAALQSAEQRLTRAAQPRLNPLLRAITRDIERIRTATLTDVPVLLLKVDELVRLADELPVGNAMPSASSMPAAPRKVPAAPAASAESAESAADPVRDDRDGFFAQLQPRLWVQNLLDALQDEARKLLRVSRIDQPEAALLAPEQTFFLRENLKLRLLNARLSLLSRQTDAARSDLVQAGSWLAKYFDVSSRKTQTALTLLQQVQGQLKTSELPRLDETMTALATAAAGR